MERNGSEEANYWGATRRGRREEGRGRKWREERVENCRKEGERRRKVLSEDRGDKQSGRVEWERRRTDGDEEEHHERICAS